MYLDLLLLTLLQSLDTLVLWEILALQDVRGSKPFEAAARMAFWMDEDAPVAYLSIYCYGWQQIMLKLRIDLVIF